MCTECKGVDQVISHHNSRSKVFSELGFPEDAVSLMAWIELFRKPDEIASLAYTHMSGRLAGPYNYRDLLLQRLPGFDENTPPWNIDSHSSQTGQLCVAHVKMLGSIIEEKGILSVVKLQALVA